MKRITLNLTNISLEKTFKIDVDQCETTDYLKTLIAAELNLTKAQFEIINPPTMHQLRETNKVCKVNILLNDLSQEVLFQFPNKKQSLIKIQYKTKKKDLASYYFKKEKINYHEKCVKYLKIIVCGIEIPDDFGLFVAPEGSIVYVKETIDFVKIEYRGFLFVFPENEIIASVQSLVAENIKNNFDILEIHNEEQKQLSLTYKIKKKEKYCVFARQFFNVRNLSDKKLSTKHYNLDPFTTVDELKAFLADVYNGDDEEKKITNDNIIIFDQHKAKVSDPNKTLLSIQDDEKMIYFDFDDSIKSDFLNSNGSFIIQNQNQSQEEIEEKK